MCKPKINYTIEPKLLTSSQSLTINGLRMNPDSAEADLCIVYWKLFKNLTTRQKVLSIERTLAHTTREGLKLVIQGCG